jgi:hypothetical protein
MMTSRMVISLMLIFAAAGIADASIVFDGKQIEFEDWFGSGSFETAIVVDFWPGNGQADSFAFGYYFDATDLVLKDVLDDLHQIDNGFSYALGKGFLTDIWYEKGSVTYHSTYNWPDSWWSQWLSTDQVNWDFGNGLEFTSVADGSIHGLLAKPGDDWTSVPVVPTVPEPATISLLGIGIMLLLRKRRA